MSEKNQLSRRSFIRTSAAGAAALSFAPFAFSCATDSGSTFGGVPIGVITYSWRSMSDSVENIIAWCKEANISSLELMGYTVEEWAGAPKTPRWPGKNATAEDRVAFRKAKEEATKKQKEWRANVDVDVYKPLKEKFDAEGIHVHTVKFAPANWSDTEIDYAFKAAKILGAGAITNEIGDAACRKLGKFAEKHGMVVAYHNHAQPGEPGFSFEDYLAHSPANMLNLDVGHYFGSTGKHPNEILEKLHDRIYSIHLKDKTGKDSTPANTNKVWGEGETPLDDILGLIKEKKWDIYADIELEYPIPEGSDAQKEIVRCVEYCKNILS